MYISVEMLLLFYFLQHNFSEIEYLYHQVYGRKDFYSTWPMRKSLSQLLDLFYKKTPTSK